MIQLCSDKEDADADIEPQHQKYDGSQASVHIGIIAEVCKINRKGIGKYQPSDRGENSSDKLLPRSLFFGRDNGIKPYKGHEKDGERKERT